MLKGISLFILFSSSVNLAFASPTYSINKYSCSKVDSKISNINKKMRTGYSAQQGERLRDDLRSLKKQRGKCKKLLTTPIDPLTPLAADNRPIGENCSKAVPPTTAGIAFTHDNFKVFPRHNDINSIYNGCQLIWRQTNNGWSINHITKFIKGSPVKVWSPRPANTDMNSCRYANGILVLGNKSICPSPESLIMKSLPAHCINAINSGHIVEGCTY